MANAKADVLFLDALPVTTGGNESNERSATSVGLAEFNLTFWIVEENMRSGGLQSVTRRDSIVQSIIK